MWLRINSLNGNGVNVMVNDDATAHDVLMVLEDIEGVPSNQLQLISKGHFLNKKDVLKKKGIFNGHTLFSAIKLSS